MTVGIDLVEIERIRKSMKNPRFITRVFGNLEQRLFTGANAYGRAGASFAAKEAFAKAIGTGIRGFSLCEVEVLRNELGAPYLRLSGRARKIAQQRELQFSVSLTHTKRYAQAIVIAYKNSDFKENAASVSSVFEQQGTENTGKVRQYDYLDNRTDETGGKAD